MPGVPSQRDVLIVVPTYNERGNLEELLTGIRAQAPAAHVLVVDDDSPDGTADAAAALGARFGGVEVMRRRGRRGIGSAYRDGFRFGLEQGYARLVTMDADLSHDPSYLPALLRATDDADYSIGSRYLRGVSVVNWSLKRLAISVAANAYARRITRMPVRDCTSGFQCIRRDVLERIAPALRFDGYAFLIECKYRAFRHGCRFRELPIVFVERRSGTSKNDVPNAFRTMFAVWGMRLRRP